MPATIHLARLDCPSTALRVACGAWREASNWTTVPALATCPRCRARAGLRLEVVPHGDDLGEARSPLRDGRLPGDIGLSRGRS